MDEPTDDIKAPAWSPEDPWGGASTTNASNFNFSTDDAWETGSDHAAAIAAPPTSVEVAEDESEAFTTPDLGRGDEFPDAQADDFGEISLEDPKTPSSSIPLGGLDVQPEPEQQQQMDDWGDFDEATGEGDDDFGDFEEHDAAVDEPIPQQPVASTSQHPLIQLDVSSLTRSHLQPQIQRALSQIYPIPSDLFTAEENTSTLPTPSAKETFQSLSLPPSVPPLNWKRSRTRRYQLTSLGVPVNLEEFTTSAQMETLVLQTNTRSASPQPLSAPIQLQSTKSNLSLQRVPTPTVDRDKAKRLLDLQEGDLSSLPLDELDTLKRDLEELVGHAGMVLTNRLEKREKLKADSGTYDIMIQDLVSTAQKLKPPMGTANVKRTASIGGRWGRSSQGSRPSSRPGSPANGAR